LGDSRGLYIRGDSLIAPLAGQYNSVKKLKRPLHADVVSFTSITHPTKREKAEVLEIERLLQKHLLKPLKEKVDDVSTLVRLKAFEAIKTIEPLEYTESEKKKLLEAQEMALAMIDKYNNGKNVQQVIKDLKQQGFVFCAGNDYLPENLWVDEEFLEAWKMDDEDIDYQLDNEIPLRVKDVLKVKGSAEIHYDRDDCKALFLFNEKPPSPETFWHEYFHYCQYKAGLMNRNANRAESQGSRFAKRELETYEFIINLRNKFKTPARSLKLDIAIWNSYKDLYNHEKESRKSRKIALQELDTTMMPVGAGNISDILSMLQSDIEQNDTIKRERSLYKELSLKYGFEPEAIKEKTQ
jgi:hypothetical protein